MQGRGRSQASIAARDAAGFRPLTPKECNHDPVDARHATVHREAGSPRDGWHDMSLVRVAIDEKDHEHRIDRFSRWRLALRAQIRERSGGEYNRLLFERGTETESTLAEQFDPKVHHDAGKGMLFEDEAALVHGCANPENGSVPITADDPLQEQHA
jgi:hypothetical protein